MKDNMKDNDKQLAEIKAREGIHSCSCAREDVPFLLAKLAASEAAAGAMREVIVASLKGHKFCASCTGGDGEHFNDCGLIAALDSASGRGWVSPEDAERLRKELTIAERALASRVALYKQVKGSSPGYVSEEECARRCREVAGEFWATALDENSEQANQQALLTAIIERVAKREKAAR